MCIFGRKRPQSADKRMAMVSIAGKEIYRWTEST